MARYDAEPLIAARRLLTRRKGQIGQLASARIRRSIVRDFANTFSDAQTKRHDADYDLNKTLSETDARLLRSRVQRAIRQWDAATEAADEDFKHALCVLVLLKGQLRAD